MKTILQKLRFLLPGLLLAVAAVVLLLLFDNGAGLMRGIGSVTNCGEESLRYHTSVRAPEMDWQIGALVGIFLGGILFAIFSGKFKLELTYGGGLGFDKIWKTLLGGIAGGFLVMCGVKISGDSIWGHLTGAIQLSVGSWIFLAAVLFAGMTTTLIASKSAASGKTAQGDEKAASKDKNQAKKGAKK